MSNKLTAKQEAFCREYLIDLNATQAAVRAGYSEHTAKDIGCQNLAKLNISKKIAQLKAERSKRVQIDADWVLTASKDLYDKCMEAEPLLDQNGEEVGFAKFNAAGAAKAIELVGKHISVKAFEDQAKGANDTLADSVNKLIDKLPN